MATVSLDLPIVGNNNSTEDPKIRSNFSAIQTAVNGNLNADNILPTVADNLGLNYTGTVHRGKSIIATEESRTNTAYGLLTTPDRVQNVVLPTDGILCVAYQAQMKQTVINSAQATIFLGAVEVVKPLGATYASVGNSVSPSTANMYATIATAQGIMMFDNAGTDQAAPPTTGVSLGDQQFNGDIMKIWAAAGTYDVSVQFKCSSGTLSVKNRKMWVWTIGF